MTAPATDRRISTEEHREAVHALATEILDLADQDYDFALSVADRASHTRRLSTRPYEPLDPYVALHAAALLLRRAETMAGRGTT